MDRELSARRALPEDGDLVTAIISSAFESDPVGCKYPVTGQPVACVSEDSVTMPGALDPRLLLRLPALPRRCVHTQARSRRS